MNAPWNDETVHELFAELQRLHPTTVRWSIPKIGAALRGVDPLFDHRVLGDRSRTSSTGSHPLCTPLFELSEGAARIITGCAAT
jgi:hypothetical protein